MIRRICFVAISLFLIIPGLSAAPPETKIVEGLRDKTPAVHALTNARIVLAPGRILDKGTIVIRDGIITSVGAEAAIPAGARTWDFHGKTIYPGLIDAYTEATVDRTT